MDDYSSSRTFLGIITFMGWFGLIGGIGLGFIIGANVSPVGAFSLMAPVVLGSMMLIVFAAIGQASIETALNTRKMAEGMTKLLRNATSERQIGNTETHASGNTLPGSTIKTYKGYAITQRYDSAVDAADRRHDNIQQAEAYIESLPAKT